MNPHPISCEEYLENPEEHVRHLESCPLCSAMTEDLDGTIDIEPRALSIDALPMATWEGATFRPWPLVAAGFSAVVILAVALFLAAGTPPLRGFARAIASTVTSFDAATEFFQLFGDGLHSAPALVHVTIAVLFVVINTILFLLLRRAPKGIDV
jgi:hypothetical protein